MTLEADFSENSIMPTIDVLGFSYDFISNVDPEGINAMNPNDKKPMTRASIMAEPNVLGVPRVGSMGKVTWENYENAILLLHHPNGVWDGETVGLYVLSEGQDAMAAGRAIRQRNKDLKAQSAFAKRRYEQMKRARAACAGVKFGQGLKRYADGGATNESSRSLPFDRSAAQTGGGAEAPVSASANVMTLPNVTRDNGRKPKPAPEKPEDAVYPAGGSAQIIPLFGGEP